MEEAAQLYEQACKVSPDDYQAPSLLATTYASPGKTAKSVASRHRSLQIIEKHLQLHPDDARAL